MAAEVIGGVLGAAPGLAVVVRAWWQRRALRQRSSALAAAQRDPGESTPSPGQRFDLWQKRHCFARQADSPALAAAKHELVVSRPQFVRRLAGGGMLALIGGALGPVIARVLAQAAA